MKHATHPLLVLFFAVFVTSAAHAVELDEGDILSSGAVPAVFRVDPATGDTVIVSGAFSGDDIGTGPAITGGAGGPALEPGGSFVLANKESDNVIRIDPSTGDRVIVSGCADSPIFPGCTLIGAGPGGFLSPTDVAVESDGNILVMDEGTSTLFRVDPVSGDRSIVSSSTVGSGVGFGIASLIELESDGSVVVYSRQFGALFRVDSVTGDRTVFSQPSVPIGTGVAWFEVSQLAVEADGGIVLTSIGVATNKSVIRVDPVTGDRSVVSGCSDFSMGICISVVGTGINLITPIGVAVESDGNLIVSDRAAVPPLGIPGVLFRINPSNGDRTIVSSFTIGSGTVAVGALTIVGAAANQPPVAAAGANQSIHAGEHVTLDGSGSSDDLTPTENLLFSWNFDSLPAGSSAILIGGATISPGFTSDLPGDYVVSLVVTDEGGLSSAPDTTTVSSLNVPPTAIAGFDQGAIVGNLVTLDGSGSSDADFDVLTFAWTLTDTPVGSFATLTGADTVSPFFVPDVPGTYVAQLVVSDGFADSTPGQVTISVVSAEVSAELNTMQAINIIASLPASSFTKDGNRKALSKRLSQVIKALQKGNITKAGKKLTKAIERTDGCALRGAPDSGNGPGPKAKKDYIADCASQGMVHPLLTDALAALGP